ncbi:hypothetical protein C8J56DRAFT_746416, partial [Mycena floridula]
EIKRQKAYLVALESQRKMLKRHVERTKALAAPIRKLTPETLGDIFSLACSNNLVSRDTTSISGQTVADVYSHWHSVSLSNKRLWSSIEL